MCSNKSPGFVCFSNDIQYLCSTLWCVDYHALIYVVSSKKRRDYKDRAIAYEDQKIASILMYQTVENTSIFELRDIFGCTNFDAMMLCGHAWTPPPPPLPPPPKRSPTKFKGTKQSLEVKGKCIKKRLVYKVREGRKPSTTTSFKPRRIWLYITRLSRNVCHLRLYLFLHQNENYLHSLWRKL